MVQSMHIIAARKITQALLADNSLTVTQLSAIAQVEAHSVRRYLIDLNLPVNEEIKAPVIVKPKFPKRNENIKFKATDLNDYKVGESFEYKEKDYDLSKVRQIIWSRVLENNLRRHTHFDIKTRIKNGKLTVTRIA